MPSHTFEEGLSAKAQIILYLSTVIDTDLEILFQIYEYYKEFTLNSEREFQMNLYRGEEHPIVKLRKSNRTNYLEDWNISSDKAYEYIGVFSSVITRVGHHIHYHPSHDRMKHIEKRYSGLFEEERVPWSCYCSECNYHLNNYNNECETDKKIAHKFWKGDDLKNTNDYVYTRIRNGCTMCKDESNICDYCCKGILTKKSCGKRSFLKYKKGIRKLKQVEGERYKSIVQNGKLLNDMKITHKSKFKRNYK